ncbi:MAG TPA: GerMN domain-containing protein [Vicinamibacterales bacterium]
MTLGRALGVVLGVAALVAAGWALWRLYGPPVEPRAARVADAPPAAVSHITATLYFGARGGMGLAPARVEVPLAPTIGGQAEAILRAALADPPLGMLRVVPRGTRLRAFFVDGRGAAFVDVTSEVIRLHPGGSFGEALTVAALVNAVTANLVAVRTVRLLVEGREIETIAGHVDVSGPLSQDTSLVVPDRRP